MPMLDIFNNDAFSLQSLTEGILKAPFQPGRIQAMGLFAERGIASTNVNVEAKDGRLALIPTSPRGGPAHQLGPIKKNIRSLRVPHYELDSTIYAEEIQGVRAFGSENELETVQAVVDERLVELRAFHEVTLEYQRLGAIKGQILDADGSVLFDLPSEFGVTGQTYNIDLNTGALSIRRQSVEIQRLVEDALGNQPVSEYHAFAGDEFFDALIDASSITNTLQYQESQMMREDLRKGFRFAGVTWENYRGRVGGVDFVESDEAVVFPMGTGIFKTYFAPADYFETVNTLGKRIYVKQFSDPELNRWTRLHSQSNALSLNLMPAAVVTLTIST
jgi:hypothetical protein